MFFSPRNGVHPPSGQVKVSAPLSDVKMTIVLLAIARSSSFFEQHADLVVELGHAGAVQGPSRRPCPDTSVWRWVQMCMRVVLCQMKNGCLAFVSAPWHRALPSRNSSSTVSIRLIVSGPVSSMVCMPTRPKRGSTVGSSLSRGAHLEHAARTELRCWNAGFFG